MKSKIYRLTCLIVSLLVAVFTVGYAFSWILDRKDAGNYVNGASAGAYFAGGDGSYANPFKITQPVHMYNLAWLQNTGRFVDENNKQKKYFFEVENDITMPAGYKLPPIGNDDNPFMGSFNGNGHTITNLQITTDKTQLYASPLESNPNYAFSNAVGMFGMTQNPPAIANTTDPDNGKVVIKNFILEDPQVEVASQNTLYSATGNKSAGIAVGFVAGKCSSIGVRATGDEGATAGNTKLIINQTGYSTFNSILGELSAESVSDVIGTGTGGNESLLVPGEIFKKATNDGTALVSKYENIFSGFNSGDGLSLHTGTWLVPSTSGNALGDFKLGALSITAGQNVKFRRQTEYSEFGYYGTVGEDNSRTYSTAQKVNLTTPTTEFEEVTNNIIDFDGNRLSKLYGRLYIENGPNGNEYTHIVDENGSFVTDDGTETGTKLTDGTTTEHFDLIRNSIKFNITIPNAKILVIAATNNSNERVLQLSKLSGESSYSEPAKFKMVQQGNSYVTADGGYSEGNAVLSRTIPLPKRVSSEQLTLVGCMFDLSGTDTTKSGEGSYMLAASSNGINFFYIRVWGVENGNQGANNYVELSNVDFIYDSVKISQEEINGIAAGKFVVGEGTGTVLYESSKTIVLFKEVEGAIALAFVRLSNCKVDNVNKTIKLNYGTTDENTTKAKATVPSYVMPVIGTDSPNLPSL